MPRSYPYGKVPSSLGVVVTERVEKPLVCCGYASAQMIARTARGGVSTNLKTEGHRIRALGGRPHWNGSNASELRTGLTKALNVQTTAITKLAVLARLKQGFAVSISLWYIRLPSYCKVQTNDFGHSSMLRGYRREGNYDYVGYFDPLFEQGSQGTWVRWVDIDQALWDGGHNTTRVKYVPPVPPKPKPPEPPTTPGGDVPTPSQYLPGYNATIKATSNVREAPNTTGKLIRTASAPETWTDILGFVKGGTDTDGGCTTDQWLCRWHGGKWEYTSKCNVTSGPTADPKPPTDPTPDQVLAIRKIEYKRVVDGSIIQPPKEPG